MRLESVGVVRSRGVPIVYTLAGSALGVRLPKAPLLVIVRMQHVGLEGLGTLAISSGR